MWDYPEYNYHISVQIIDSELAIEYLQILYDQGLKCCNVRHHIEQLKLGQTTYQPFIDYLPNQGYFRLHLAVHFDEIDANVFRFLPKLNIYAIELNNEKYLPENYDFSTSDILPYLDEIKFLRIENVRTSKPQKLIDNMSELEILLLSNTGLTELHQDMFPRSSIKVLILNIQPVETIHKEAFNQLSQIQVLIIGIMMTNSIPEGLFDRLQNLQYLDLHTTDITDIGSKHLRHNTELIALKLPETVKYFPYCKLPKLRRLYHYDRTILDDKYLALERLEALSLLKVT